MPRHRVGTGGTHARWPGELAVARHGVRTVSRENALQNGLGPAGLYANLRQPWDWDDRLAVTMALPRGGALTRAAAHQRGENSSSLYFLQRSYGIPWTTSTLGIAAD